MNRRDTAEIDRVNATAQLALYLSRVRPEMLARETADTLARRFRVPRGEIERRLNTARQGSIGL